MLTANKNTDYFINGKVKSAKFGLRRDFVEPKQNIRQRRFMNKQTTYNININIIHRSHFTEHIVNNYK